MPWRRAKMSACSLGAPAVCAENPFLRDIVPDLSRTNYLHTERLSRVIIRPRSVHVRSSTCTQRRSSNDEDG